MLMGVFSRRHILDLLHFLQFLGVFDRLELCHRFDDGDDHGVRYRLVGYN